jgi:integrase
MTFVIDKEVLKEGLIIFRRGDVDHRNWYCRIKLPKADRYKTISLKTADKATATSQAFKEDTRVQIRLEDGIAVFNRSFSQVAKEYASLQDQRVKNGEIKAKRAEIVRSVIGLQLDRYVGTTQVHLIGKDRWDAYPAWRRTVGQGRVARVGSTRSFTDEEKAAEEARFAAAMATYEAEKLRAERVGQKPSKRLPTLRTQWVIVSDSTIRTEMTVFRAVMAYAIAKRYVAADRAFGEIPGQLEVMRRDEFTLEEYRKLHTVARAWIKEATRPRSIWYRTVAYNFILIMCNTGMRPPEAKNLRWRDISTATDREGREIVVMWVRGKDKQRKLVAPKAVGDYFERIREITKRLCPRLEMAPDHPVFVNYEGGAEETLFTVMIRDILKRAGLLLGPTGVQRSTYCFRHTYATFRLSEGVDVYFLAEQMGTSVQMIEQHYGHVNTIRHADRVLQGMHGWDPEGLDGVQQETDQGGLASSALGKKARPKSVSRANAAARQAIKLKQPKVSAPNTTRP